MRRSTRLLNSVEFFTPHHSHWFPRKGYWLMLLGAIYMLMSKNDQLREQRRQFDKLIGLTCHTWNAEEMPMVRQLGAIKEYVALPDHEQAFLMTLHIKLGVCIQINHFIENCSGKMSKEMSTDLFIREAKKWITAWEREAGWLSVSTLKKTMEAVTFLLQLPHATRDVLETLDEQGITIPLRYFDTCYCDEWSCPLMFDETMTRLFEHYLKKTGVNKNYGTVEKAVLRKAMEKTVLAYTAVKKQSLVSLEDRLKAICEYGLSTEYVTKLSDAQIALYLNIHDKKAPPFLFPLEYLAQLHIPRIEMYQLRHTMRELATLKGLTSEELVEAVNFHLRPTLFTSAMLDLSKRKFPWSLFDAERDHFSTKLDALWENPYAYRDAAKQASEDAAHTRAVWASPASC